MFGRERVYLEVQRHLDAEQAHRNRDVLAQAEALGVGVVATNDVRYATPAQRIVHDVLTCAREKATVDEIGRRLPPNGERWLKPPAEMARLFRDLPAAVRATRDIAERCAFTLANLGYVFPDYDVPPGETQQSFLEKLSWDGRPLPLRRRRSDPAQGAPAAGARARHHRSPRPRPATS